MEVVSGREGPVGVRAGVGGTGWRGGARVRPRVCWQVGRGVAGRARRKRGGGGVVGAQGGRGVLPDVADGGEEGGRAAGGVLEGGEVVVEV